MAHNQKGDVSMTYLDLVNRFWDLDEAYNFTALEAKLYFKLLDIANKMYWKQKTLSIPMKKLQATLGVSKNTILKARKRLASTGLITFTPGQTSRCAAIYEIIGFDCSRKEAELSFFEQKNDADEVVQNQRVRMNKNLNDIENEVVNEPVNVNQPLNDVMNKDVNEKATTSVNNHGEVVVSDFESVRTDERDSEPIRERSSERSPDPYIRLDKDKEEEEEEIINNLPWERFDRLKSARGIWDPDEIVNRFNDICTSLTKVKYLKANTRMMLTQRNDLFHSTRDWEAFFQKVADSDFLSGKNEFEWQADLEWLVKDDETVLSVLQGKYDNNSCEVFSLSSV
ncbi:MAG: hypothetical protein ACOC4J_03360 [Bacteroidota bacterium]